jgi:hypothetical protein|tara:strand:+ start:63 stop:914 length:852 start_codon:yes stop_codon:yes gene_type:complete
MKKEKYIINPSELSYICHHCAHLKHNYDLEDKGISAGITGELDSLEKKYFLGDVKKLGEKIPKGTIINADHLNMSFQSKILCDKKNRTFRIKGKGDAIIKFEDKTHGIIDYKTSKFKDKKGKNYSKELQDKINEYNAQLHCYDLLYSNLETDKEFLIENLKSSRPTWKEETILNKVNERIEKIKEISIKKTSLMGLVFVYPEELVNQDSLLINFSFTYENVKYEPEKFIDFLTDYIDHLEQPNPPPIPEKCKDPKNRQHCVMHTHFYDEKKIKKTTSNRLKSS